MAHAGKHVVIMGGGVAGMTAAHELLERGFKVTLCEFRELIGGKSRSYFIEPLPYKGKALRRKVPAEHGFRFFAGFYHHLDRTMRQIPLPGRRESSVLDCLVPIREEILGVASRPPIKMSVATSKVRDIRGLFRFPESLLDVGLTPEDLRIFSGKLWQLATSCRERRNTEYEQLGWREFVESRDRSDEYYWYLASGLMRALVAARARKASTKTMGNVALELLMSLYQEPRTMDRVLNGPTNEVWFGPWEKHLRDKFGAKFDLRTSTCIEGARVSGGKLQSVTTRAIDWASGNGVPTKKTAQLHADYFVSALSVDHLAKLIETNPSFAKAGKKQFSNIRELARPEGEHLQWMSGLQIYLKKDEPINRGHQLFLDSAWGLTSISQAQFWNKNRRFLPKGVGGVLSIDISSWELAGLNGRMARDCDKEAILAEVLQEIRVSLRGKTLRDSNIVGWYLDESVVLPNPARKSGEHVPVNLEPVLVNHADSWRLRPTPTTALGNLFLAGDFVQTTTDLACMEGANEAARLAVNALLESAGFPDHARCWLATPAVPALLAPLQEADAYRYERGLAWSGIDVGSWLVTGAHAATLLGDLTFGGPPDHGGEGSDRRTRSGLAEPRPPKQTPDVPYHLPRTSWDGQIATQPAGATATAIKGQSPFITLTAAAIDDARGTRYARPGRADPMFKRWRLQGLDYQGQRYLVPFHAYEADALIIHGHANHFAFLESQTRGTEFRPAFCRIDGKKVGYAELWIIHYEDTVGGRYNELVMNFVVRKNESREYSYRSPYSSIVPMNDSGNRLFTPRLLLQELDEPDKQRDKRRVGPIAYGRKLMGFDKQKAIIDIGRNGNIKRFHCVQDRMFTLSGWIDETERISQTMTNTTELARELGVIELAKSIRQATRGEELLGGLVTKDFRISQGKGPETVEVLATYKFAPTVCLIDDAPPKKTAKYDRDLPFAYNPKSPFGALMADIGFSPTIATRDPKLKSVLYLNGWPTPDDP